jgi:hypothetical protein
MAGEPNRLRMGLLWIVAVVAIAACAVLVLRTSGTPPPADRADPAPRTAPPDPSPPVVAAAPVPEPRPRTAPPGPEPDRAAEPTLSEIEAMRGPWRKVDLEAVRAAMPENLYWEMAVPTRDPEVEAERERRRGEWNRQYGKVLSNTATEEEIHAYYDLRRRLSSDYIEFATYVLDAYRDELPERDVGLLELAIRLHHARLEEIPRRIADALERKQAHDAAREAWLEQEAAFREGAPAAPGAE